MFNLQISQYSKSFYIAALRCQEQRPLNDGSFEMPMGPAIVNLAFSIELGMKALRKTTEKIHKLEALFKTLPEDVKNRIINAAGERPDVFQQKLMKVNNIFTEWRYVHEGGPKELDLQFTMALGTAIQQELRLQQGSEQPSDNPDNT